MKKYQFTTNIMCGDCVAKVTPYLNENNDIKQWSVDTKNPTKVLTVETDNLSPEAVEEMVKKAGYKAALLTF